MNILKRIMFSIIAVVLIIGAVGCSKALEADETLEVETVTVYHEKGETVVKKNPQRVIVFDYGILDSLDVMEIDVIGLPKQSLPAYLEKFKGDDYIDAGTLKEPNFEVIYESAPDLIIISTRQLELYEDFNRIAPTIYMPMENGLYMESFKKNINTLVQIFDKADKIAERMSSIEKSIEELNQYASENIENGLFVMANDGNLSVYGEGSRFGIVYEEFGIEAADKNIESSTHGQKVTFEYIHQLDPEYIFVMDRAAVTGGELSAKSVMDNDIVKMTRAWKENKIAYLDAHVWYVAAGGIRSTEKMIDEVMDAVKQNQ